MSALKDRQAKYLQKSIKEYWSNFSEKDRWDIHGDFCKGFDAFRESPEYLAMKEALEFYADRSNWASKSGKIGITEIWTEDYDGIQGEPYQPSQGKRAREVLKEIEK